MTYTLTISLLRSSKAWNEKWDFVGICLKNWDVLKQWSTLFSSLWLLTANLPYNLVIHYVYCLSSPMMVSSMRARRMLDWPQFCPQRSACQGTNQSPFWGVQQGPGSLSVCGLASPSPSVHSLQMNSGKAQLWALPSLALTAQRYLGHLASGSRSGPIISLTPCSVQLE